jgi:hypothetical protein
MSAGAHRHAIGAAVLACAATLLATAPAGSAAPTGMPKPGAQFNVFDHRTAGDGWHLAIPSANSSSTPSAVTSSSRRATFPSAPTGASPRPGRSRQGTVSRAPGASMRAGPTRIMSRGASSSPRRAATAACITSPPAGRHPRASMFTSAMARLPAAIRTWARPRDAPVRRPEGCGRPPDARRNGASAAIAGCWRSATRATGSGGSDRCCSTSAIGASRMTTAGLTRPGRNRSCTGGRKIADPSSSPSCIARRVRAAGPRSPSRCWAGTCTATARR